ncbi:CAP domain-containing protein [Clostridium sp. AL.422]|uniref:CAP domain-containing protein n=1 Tax=Clostridium TaxID=1485 RepID=UPI00293DEBBD|nr:MULTISPECIES: CAP domain-containing protein [unclassified Clostridium]MDV4150161.1 CAP domain-containing protein [Clostridium sp. AL.422]
MSRSKLIIVLSSIGLVVILAVGGILLVSNKETPNNIEQTENKEEKQNNVVKEDNKNNNTNNNENNNIPQDNSDTNQEAEKYDSNNETDNSSPEIEEGNNNSSNNVTPSTESKPPSNPNTVSDNSYIGEIEQAIFQRVNQERAAAGVPALSYNTTMEYYARIKSKDMGDNGYFSHEDLQGNLITVKMQADGVSYRAWAENIAYIQGMDGNSSIATKFMDNWMNSSGHRANILSTNYTSIGVGVYKIGNTYYATQEFYK